MKDQHRSGGRILIDGLKANDVETVFCVPGESYLAALDALVDTNSIRVVTCRQEGGAAFMAESYAKLTGKTGVCFVTRGPGATNASIGVHTAMQDSTPMVLLVGQVARDMRGREAFQEIDYEKMFAPPFTKWAVEVNDAARLPEIISRAFAVAGSGRPGPVVVSLPEDVLTDVVVANDVPRAPVTVPSPQDDDLRHALSLLQKADKPLAIIGGGSWTEEGITAFENFAKDTGLPVAVTFRRQDAFDNHHDCYVGALGTTVDPSLLETVKQADVILALGTRLSEMSTQGYEIIQPPRPLQKLIHVYPDTAELGKVYYPDVAIAADVNQFAKRVEKMSLPDTGWHGRTDNLRQDYLQFSKVQVKDQGFDLDMDQVFTDLLSVLPEDAIITTDAGNFSGWAQRYIRYARPMRLLAPTSGAMGYGVPSAVAAAVAAPRRKVIGMMGDGGFMMTGQELATALHEKVAPIFLVFNNGMYGTIRMHQEKHYPGRVSATHLTNPDFAMLAQSYGANGVTVAKNADFLPAFKQALASDKPTLIELRMAPDQLSTAKLLSEM